MLNHLIKIPSWHRCKHICICYEHTKDNGHYFA